MKKKIQWTVGEKFNSIAKSLQFAMRYTYTLHIVDAFRKYD